jgi:hypothetical protein
MAAPSPLVLRLSVIACAIGALVLYIWAFSGLGKPREKLRVYHPTGYSIIAPPGWISIPRKPALERYLADSLTLEPERSIGKVPRLFVGSFSGTPDVTELLRTKQLFEGSFMGEPAYVREGLNRGMWMWRAIFERSGRWYELVLWLPHPAEVERTEYFAFLQSFKPAKAPESAATAPSLPVE